MFDLAHYLEQILERNPAFKVLQEYQKQADELLKRAEKVEDQKFGYKPEHLDGMGLFVCMTRSDKYMRETQEEVERTRRALNWDAHFDPVFMQMLTGTLEKSDYDLIVERTHPLIQRYEQKLEAAGNRLTMRGLLE